MKISVALRLMIILAVAANMVSCKKTLQEYNPSGLTAETVYNTPSGYETLVNAAYSYNRSWYGKEEGIGISEFGTDLWTAGSESFAATSGLAGENRSLILYQNLNPVNQNVTRLWKQMYAAVNLCNTGIRIAENPEKFTPNKVRAAELRFLRAWYYWHIVETWGEVHFTTDPTDKVVMTANRTPVEKFYEQIIADLTTAIPDLNETSDYGRVNRNVAKAFLARVYLTYGYKDASYFSQAKTQALEVINSGKYSLVPNYEDLWDMSKQKNSEVIWSVNYAQDPNISDVYNEKTNPYGYGVDILSANGNPTNNRGNNNLHTVFIPLYDRAYPEFGNPSATSLQVLKRDVRYGWPFARVKPTKFLLDLFDAGKDSRYKGSFRTVWKANYIPSSGKLAGKTVYEDTALVIDKNPAPSADYYTFDVNTTFNAQGGSATITENKLFPALIKFQDSTRSASPNDQVNGNVQSAKDVFVIRLAEMHMIAAEASFQLGDPQGAADQINELRERAALPGMYPSFMASAGDISLNFILDEKAREFAGENTRWFDLKRTGTLVPRVQAYNPDLAVYIQHFHNFRPIPQIQIDVVQNKSEFHQNSGY